MRLHDAVRYALYVSSAIGGAGTSRFGAQRKIMLGHLWTERDMRYVLQNAALDVLVRVLNFGFDGSSNLRLSQNLIGRGAVLSLRLKIMGGDQDEDDAIYGFTEGAKGARPQLADLIARLWKYMRMVHQRDSDPNTDPKSRSNGLVAAIKMLLQKFYVGAHVQKALQVNGRSVIKPRQGDPDYAEKKVAWDAYIEPLAKPHDETFERLYQKRMGIVIAPKARRSKKAEQGEPSTKKRRSKEGEEPAMRVKTYPELATSVVHDALVIYTATGHVQTVVLGKEPVDAIINAADPEKNTEHDALAVFLLHAIGRGGDAKPLVVVITAFGGGGGKHRAFVYDFNDEGSQDPVSGSVLEMTREGIESKLISDMNYTHVALVVDARVVTTVRPAVSFWKNNKRGLNRTGQGGHKCAWTTVLIAPTSPMILPGNSVVIGTVEIGQLPVVSGSCRGTQLNRQALSVRGLRTYDGDLKVTNVVTIKPDAIGLARLAKRRCTETRIKENLADGYKIEAKLPIAIAVIDVREIGVTADNIDHFMALGTMRNYIMLTTQVQHDAIAASWPPPPRKRLPKKDGAEAAGAQGALTQTIAPEDAALADLRARAMKSDYMQLREAEAEEEIARARAIASMRMQARRRRNSETAHTAGSAEQAAGTQSEQIPNHRPEQQRIPKKVASGPDGMEQGSEARGKGGLEALRDQPLFGIETVTILKQPVKYTNSDECEMARHQGIRSALSERKGRVTFLLVKPDPAAQGTLRHHGAVMRKLKKPIHGTLFYVECTATGDVSFEIVSGGSVGGAPRVSGTMRGADLPGQLDAAEERYTKGKKTKQPGAKVHPPHVFVLCR